MGYTKFPRGSINILCTQLSHVPHGTRTNNRPGRRLWPPRDYCSSCESPKERLSSDILKTCGQIFSSRPLYPQLRTTPLAGARFSSHLRALLLLFGTYLPPPTTLSGAVNIPSSSRATRVSEEILTEALIESLKTRICFVGEPLATSMDDFRMDTDTSDLEGTSSIDRPSSAVPSESDFSRVSRDMDDRSAASQSGAASSDFSVVSHSQVRPTSAAGSQGRLDALATLYQRHSTATDLRIRVVPPTTQQTGTGRGTLVIPGWIRERAAEVLFEGGDIDEGSVAETILDALLKV
jgi:actin-related protein 10